MVDFSFWHWVIMVAVVAALFIGGNGCKGGDEDGLTA
jgi:hypothetical protein